MRTELILRFDYGRTVPWVTRLQDGGLRAIAGPDMVTLHTPVRLRGQDLERIYRGLASTDPKVQSSSRELLEALLDSPMREAVLALVNDVPDRLRMAEAQAFYRPQDLGYEALLGQLLEEPGETLRCLAAYHVAELGLTEFRPRLEAAQKTETGLFVTRVLERALRLLSEPRLRQAVHAT